MEPSKGVLDRSNSYVSSDEHRTKQQEASQRADATRCDADSALVSGCVSRSVCSPGDIAALLAATRPRSPTRARSASGSTTTATSSNGASASMQSIGTPIHSLMLQGSVFQDSSESAMVQFQRLLRRFVPSLEVLNAAKSNITGRVFYSGRTFLVHEPEKEHVSVEAVQANTAPTVVAGLHTNSSSMATGATNETATGSTAPQGRNIVRDDHPPLIIAVRIADDADSSGGSDDDQSSGDDSSGQSEGEGEESSEEGEGEGETVEQRNRRRRRRRRKDIQPEIIDLEAIPLADLLARQSSNPQIAGVGPAASSAAMPGSGGALIPQSHNYYFYVRTLFHPDDATFLRYYVKLNWLRKLNWIDMSGTSISGYGVVSLIASCCSNIQCLFLSDCQQLDNMGVYSIVNLCQSLKQLDISGCTKVNRFGLMYLAEFKLHVVQNCLEIIDVSHCGGNDAKEEAAGGRPTSTSSTSHGALFPVSPTPSPHGSTSNPTGGGPSTARLTSSSSNLASPFSGQLVSLALFNALEERGFRGRFIWQHTPRREEIVGDPQVIRVPVPMAQPAVPGPDGLLPNVFAPPVQQYQLQLSSPFLQHYQLSAHRIIDLAMRDITNQVVTEIPWEIIRQQDEKRVERLKTHKVKLGIHAASAASPAMAAAGIESADGDQQTKGGFVEAMERMERERHLLSHPSADGSGPPVPAPVFYSLNLSGQLVNDRLLFYILVNWGPRLYELVLDGTYITSAGLSELKHCTHLHLLSLTSCLNLIDKTRANAILKESLRGMVYLAELNLTHSRLSGRMMSSHPNLKLEVLIANGCPISSFAMRMLASGAAGGAGGFGTDGQQNMCKYSLRFLSLSNCAFVNRKSLEYVLKFAYLQLLDVSECRGLKREDLTEVFLTAAEAEIRAMEQAVMGGGAPPPAASKKGKSSSSGAPTTFGMMLCHLRHIVCFGLGSTFSEKRAADFSRELTQHAAKLQQLLLLQHHQQVAAQQAFAAASVASASNLTAPSPLGCPRQIPLPPPAYLRRDFHKDPIAIVANRNAGALARYTPTLTRFVVHQSQHGGQPAVVAVPSGLQIGHASGHLSIGVSQHADPSVAAHMSVAASPPPLFRGSSLLDECPYSFLPLAPTPLTSSPALGTPSAGTAGGKTDSRTDLASIAVASAPGKHQASFFTNSTHASPTSHLPQSNSYMMMLNEQASGGVAIMPSAAAPGSTTIGPGGVPHGHTTPVRPTAAPQHSALSHTTWQQQSAHFPSTSPAASPTTNGGDLYFSLTPDLLSKAHAFSSAPSHGASMPPSPNPLSLEGVARTPAGSPSSTNPNVHSPGPGFAALTITPSSATPALPYAAVSSLPAPMATAANPTPSPAPSPGAPTPSSGSAAAHAPLTTSSIVGAGTPSPLHPSGVPTSGVSGILSSSFWSTFAAPVSASSSNLPPPMPQVASPATSVLQFPAPTPSFVSPFAALGRPAATTPAAATGGAAAGAAGGAMLMSPHVQPLPPSSFAVHVHPSTPPRHAAFPTPFPFSSVPTVGGASADGARVSAPGEVSPLQPGMTGGANP